MRLLDAKAIPDLSIRSRLSKWARKSRQPARRPCQIGPGLHHPGARRPAQAAAAHGQGPKCSSIWPRRNDNAFDPVDTLVLPPETTLLRTAREPSSQDFRRAVEAAGQADKVVAITYDAVRNPAQQGLVRALLAVKPQGLIHVAMGGPYDLSLFPDAPASIATYGDVPVSVQALASAMSGTIAFRGRLPGPPAMILSATRRADIPAHYAQWFMNRIDAGWCAVPNPFNSRQVDPGEPQTRGRERDRVLDPRPEASDATPRCPGFARVPLRLSIHPDRVSREHASGHAPSGGSFGSVQETRGQTGPGARALAIRPPSCSPAYRILTFISAPSSSFPESLKDAPGGRP